MQINLESCFPAGLPANSNSCPVIDLTAARSRRAAARNTGIPLLDVDPQTAAEVLAGSDLSRHSWLHRAQWFENIVGDSLNKACELHDELSQETLREIVRGMRSQVTRILDHLERLRKLPANCDALRVYSVSDDPARLVEVRWHWSARDEHQAMEPGSALFALRHLIVLHEAGGVA